MNNPDRREDSIWAGERLYIIPAVAIIVVMLTGCLGLALFALIPAVQARTALVSQLAEAEQALEKAQQFQQTTPEQWMLQIEETRATLDQAAAIFLSDSQAADLLNKLYLYASENGVTIANLQTLPGAEGADQRPHDVVLFQLQAKGPVPALLRFAASIQEAGIQGFVINDAKIIAAGEQSVLTMNVTLYTSPYAPGGSATYPSPTLTVEEQLEQRLRDLWVAENWGEVISVLEQIVAINPDNYEMREKLYSAHVNYGYQLAAEGRPAEAKEQFSRALIVKPGGKEATEGLQQTAGDVLPPTPVSQTAVIIYTVRQGDTLYSISTRYATTVPAIKAANGLTDDTIKVGQELKIPSQ